MKHGKTIRLLEVVQSTGAKVSREEGVIRDVKILGRTSANKRTYTKDAIGRAKAMYEGLAVNVNHPSRKDPDAERAVEDRFGWLANVRESDDGLHGDLHYLKSDPRAEKVCEAAERRPEMFGLSHNAEGKTRRENGNTIVEEITRVRSVDIVSDPATTRSLFESLTEDEEPMPTTVRQILESFPADSQSAEVRLLRSLLEQDDMAMMGDAQVDVAPESSSDDQIKAAFRTAVVAAFDDTSLDSKATLAKIKTILSAYDKIAEEPKEKTSDDGGEKKEETAESLRAERDELRRREGVRALLESEGRTATPALLKALTALETDEDRKAMLAELPKPAGEKPRSTGRLLEAKRDSDTKPTDVTPEQWAARLKRQAAQIG